MKKALRETQTLRAGCSKAEPKIFAPPQTPFPRARDGQNLISWRWSLPSPTHPVWWRSMHAISSYCGNRPTNKQTNTQTDRGDYNTQRRSLARSVNIIAAAAAAISHLNTRQNVRISSAVHIFTTVVATIHIPQLGQRWRIDYVHTYQCTNTLITLRAKLSGAVYCYRSCLWRTACVCVCVCVCGSVTRITRNCVHRSSPNWVCT